MFERKWARRGLILIAACFVFFHVLGTDVFARVGGGGTSGSRGSRPSAPSKSYTQPQPSQPSQQQRQYAPSPAQPTGSPFLRGLAGGLVGGMIGSLLFGGLGFAGGHGGGWGGPGLFDILLIGALLYGIYWFVMKRRRAAPAAASYQSRAEAMEPAYAPQYGQAHYEEVPSARDELQRGLDHIRQMDSSFDEARFRDLCTDSFFKIQGAWENRDMASVQNLLTDEMFRTMQGDADKLRAEGKFNKLDSIAVRSVDLMEAWQESGQDYITVLFYANLLDYTVDEASGNVISGSKTEPVKFKEYWTLTRPVGNNPWQLSAISQAE